MKQSRAKIPPAKLWNLASKLHGVCIFRTDLLTCIGGILFFSSPIAFAANTPGIVWDGGGGSAVWSDGNNWDGTGTQPIPTNLTYLVMAGGLRLTNNVDNGSMVNMSGLQFSNDVAASFVIFGNTLTNGSLGIFNQRLGQQTISNRLELIANQTFTNSGGLLLFAGVVTNQGNNLSLTGAGNFRFDNSIDGAGGLTHIGTGTNVLNAAMHFTGNITNQSGVLESQNASGLSSANVFLSGGTLVISTVNQSYNQTFNLLGTATNEVASGITFTLGNIADDLTGSGLLVKTGNGILMLSNANNNTGGVQINAGRVEILTNASLGSGTLTLNGGELFNSIPTLFITNNLNVTASSSLVGTNGSDTVFVNKNITATAGTTLFITNTGTSSSRLIRFLSNDFTYAGDIQLDDSSRLRFDHNSGTNIISGIIKGSGFTNIGVVNPGVEMFGAGALILSNANTFTTLLQVDTGVVIIASADALGSASGRTIVTNGATLAMMGGANGITYTTVESTLIQGVGQSGQGVFENINGTNSYAGNFIVVADATISTLADKLTLSGSITNSTKFLTITNAGSSSLVISGVLGANSGSGGIIHTGIGSLVFANSNTFTGGITNSGGTIESQVQGGLSTGTIVLNGGGLSFTTVNQTNSQAIAVTLSSTISVGPSITETMSGIISGAGGINKMGTGTLSLKGNNTFTGAVTNSLGILQIDSALGLGSATSLSVAGGTYLFNTGVTNTSANMFMNGGAIQEADQNVSLGILSISGNSSITLNSGGSAGSFRFASGTNTIGAGATLTIYGWGYNSATGGGSDDLIFFTSSTAETSTFLNNITFFGTGGGAELLSSGELVPITPEPSTMLGASFLFALLLKSIKRRTNSKLHGEDNF